MATPTPLYLSYLAGRDHPLRSRNYLSLTSFSCVFRVGTGICIIDTTADIFQFRNLGKQLKRCFPCKSVCLQPSGYPLALFFVSARYAGRAIWMRFMKLPTQRLQKHQRRAVEWRFTWSLGLGYVRTYIRTHYCHSKIPLKKPLPSG